MLGFKNFLLDEEGIGVVEMILIVVVLIGLVVLFKSKLTTLVTNIFSTITDRAGEVYCGRGEALPFLQRCR
jgi:Flp pilus assembly pilin Flp